MEIDAFDPGYRDTISKVDEHVERLKGDTAILHVYTFCPEAKAIVPVNIIFESQF